MISSFGTDITNIYNERSPDIISGLFAWYDATSWSSPIWTDKSGNGRNASSTGTITTSTISNVFALTGGTTAIITFPSGVCTTAVADYRYIDDFRLYNRSLSFDEITELHNYRDR